jgi:hypothetical protein
MSRNASTAMRNPPAAEPSRRGAAGLARLGARTSYDIKSHSDMRVSEALSLDPPAEQTHIEHGGHNVGSQTEPTPNISLSDATVRLALLTEICRCIHQVDEPRLAEFITSGMPMDLVDVFDKLSHGDLKRLAESKAYHIRVAFDWKQLKMDLERIQKHRRQQETLEYFIRHGASRRLTRRLFSLTETDHKRMATALGIDAARRGRVSLPSQREREAIGARWYALGKTTTDLRRRYLELHQAFEAWSICALESVVDHFEADSLHMTT